MFVVVDGWLTLPNADGVKVSLEGHSPAHTVLHLQLTAKQAEDLSAELLRAVAIHRDVMGRVAGDAAPEVRDDS